MLISYLIFILIINNQNTQWNILHWIKIFIKKLVYKKLNKNRSNLDFLLLLGLKI
jgi:hypothetical protein